MTSPSVELHFNPTDLRPGDLPPVGAFLGSPAEALEVALSMVRARMVSQMKAEARGLTEPTYGQLLRLADMTWQLFLPQYRKISAPVIADAYVRAWADAEAGDVPMSVIYDLAEKHAEKVGGYFHASSRDALAEGFNTMVNRRIPAKAAADKVLDAYGLTPRQMRGYANNKQLITAVDSPVSLDVKARSREYIDRSFTGRVRKLAEQEEHNIDEQAKQFAWMWLQDKGRLNERAQKMWITAHDERVCPVCGPLHGQKVLVGEQFKTHEGDFWSPGIHPNCRCVVRLIENKFRLEKRHDIAKADWEPKEHPRGGDPENRGRFSRVLEKDRPAPIWEQLADVEVEPEVEPEVEAVVEEPMINITQGMISIAPKHRAKSQISIAPQAEISIAPEQISIAQPTISIAPEKTISIVGAPAEVHLAQPEVAVKPIVKPEVKPDLAPLAKTFLLAKDGSSFYAVIHESEYDTDMTLQKKRFTSSRAEAASMVTEARENRIDELLDEKIGSHRDKPIHVTGEDPETGEWMEGYVSASDFEGALREQASFTHAAGDYDMEMDDLYENVIWTNAAGHRVSEDYPVISQADLMSQAGVHPHEFAYRVLAVSEGHRDENDTRMLGRGKFDLSGHYVEEGPTTDYLTDNEGHEIPIVPLKPYE